MWAFDFVDDRGRLGGFVALSFSASARRAWYWAALVGEGRPYLLVRDLTLVAGQGWRRHAWGPWDWAATPWSLRGGTADGRPWAAPTPPPGLELAQRAPVRLGDDGGSGHLERTLVSFGDPVGSGWTQEARLEH